MNRSSFAVGDRVTHTTKWPKVFRVGTVRSSVDVGRKTERHFVRWDDDHAAHGFFSVPEVRASPRISASLRETRSGQRLSGRWSPTGRPCSPTAAEFIEHHTKEPAT